MSISVSYQAVATVIDTPSALAGATSGAQLPPFDGYKTTATYTGSSSAPVTKYSNFRKTLSGSTGTIDLTSLPDALGSAAAVTFSGLKVQVWRVKAASANAGNYTLTKGASNGYGHGTGGSTWTWVVPAGTEMLMYIPEGTPDVSGSAKNIDLSGTSGDYVDITLVAG